MGGWHRTALKRCLRRETHRTPIRRMAEAKFLGMEIETVARRAIERVTFNRIIQAQLVRTMHTQLMRTSRLRPKP